MRENTRGKYTTIVIPTLLRESIFKTMSYIRQYTEAEVIPYYDPTVNEYVVRNLVAEGVTTPTFPSSTMTHTQVQIGIKTC